MTSEAGPVEIAVLDDYQGVALEMADWSVLNGRARITVFRDHIADDRAVVERGVMRERTPVERSGTIITTSILSGLHH